MNTRLIFQFCSTISNQAYKFNKLTLKQRLNLFYINPKVFTNKDKAALIMTLSPAQMLQKDLTKKMAEDIDAKTMQHKELSILANFFALNKLQNTQLWNQLALRGFKIIEDFDRDSLPKFLNAIDRSEQVEIKQFWDAIYSYARRNLDELNSECSLSLFCNLIRRYPSSSSHLEIQKQQQNNEISTQQEQQLQNSNKQQNINSINDSQDQIYSNDINNDGKPQQFDEMTQKLIKSQKLLKIQENDKIQTKEEWEIETKDVIFDIFNHILKRHIKNFDGNQILLFMNYLASYRSEWIQINGLNNLKISLVYLEEQLEQVENLTFLLLTLFQALEKTSAQPSFFIKNKSQINSQNIHLVCAFLECIDVKEKSVIWKCLIEILIQEHQKIIIIENQQIITSSLINCNIIPQNNLSKQSVNFNQLIQQLTNNF